MKLLLIRHGKTEGNREKRYIGRTDEPLCPEGRSELEGRRYPPCTRIFASPMRRCLETAELIYPGQEIVCCRDLRECDFGEFEGKNYPELSGDPRYQAWIDSGGTLPFPGGESNEIVRDRCCRAFWALLEGCREDEVPVFVVHGGTIMAVLAAYGVPKKNMYEYQVGNGCGYEVICGRREKRLRICGCLYGPDRR